MLQIAIVNCAENNITRENKWKDGVTFSSHEYVSVLTAAYRTE